MPASHKQKLVNRSAARLQKTIAAYDDLYRSMSNQLLDNTFPYHENALLLRDIQRELIRINALIKKERLHQLDRIIELALAAASLYMTILEGLARKVSGKSNYGLWQYRRDKAQHMVAHQKLLKALPMT